MDLLSLQSWPQEGATGPGLLHSPATFFTPQSPSQSRGWKPQKSSGIVTEDSPGSIPLVRLWDKFCLFRELIFNKLFPIWIIKDEIKHLRSNVIVFILFKLMNNVTYNWTDKAKQWEITDGTQHSTVSVSYSCLWSVILSSYRLCCYVWCNDVCIGYETPAPTLIYPCIMYIEMVWLSLST